MRKISSAIAAGCSIIIKPAEETPAGTQHIAQALLDAGLPTGVVNILHGDPNEISNILIASPEVRAVTFTGSVSVGRKLAALAGSYLKPCVMELGGHAPVIVCKDVDVAKVAQQAAQAKINNCGQVCVSPTRFYVAQEIFEQFLSEFKKNIESFVVGDGLDEASDIGPLTNQKRVSDIQRLVTNAVECGAKLVSGGNLKYANSNFYEPTILADVPKNAWVMQEEPFGPVAIVNKISSIQEGIMEANSTPYGLAAYIFTKDANISNKIKKEIQAGNIGINDFRASLAETPFGGVKDSGYGREGGESTLHAFTSVKTIIKNAR